jgi:hypothetical protein
MKILTLFALILSFYSTHAQTLAEEMGAVSCAFEFSSNGSKLEVKKQLLTERPKSKKEVSTTENESYGLAYAYSEWQLEFVLTREFGTRKITESEDLEHRSKYCIQLLDSNGVTLVKMYFARDILNHWKGGTTTEPSQIYSLNMVSFPFVILDDVATIDIVWIEHSR